MNKTEEQRLDDIFAEVKEELKRATRKFGPFNSPHEGYAIIKEEVEELWDDIKANNYENQRAESIQVAAMALRFIFDLEELAEKRQDQKQSSALPRLKKLLHIGSK